MNRYIGTELQVTENLGDGNGMTLCRVPVYDIDVSDIACDGVPDVFEEHTRPIPAALLDVVLGRVTTRPMDEVVLDTLVAQSR